MAEFKQRTAGYRERIIIMNKAIETTESKKLIKLGVTDKALAELRKKYALIPNARKPDGYEQIRNGIAETRKYRGLVKKEGEIQKKDALTHQRAVNAEQNRITDALLEIEEPMKSAKEVVDNEQKRIEEEKAVAEEKRSADIYGLIAEIESHTPGINDSLEQIQIHVDWLNERKVYEGEFGELQQQAEETLSETINIVLAKRKERAEYEDNRTRIKEENKRIEEQQSEIKAAQAKIDVEKAIIERQKRDEEIRQEEKQRAENAAQEAEARVRREAQEKEEAEKQERLNREADEAHRTAINAIAIDAIINYRINEKIAKDIIDLIADHLIPGVSINY